jgi:hypothetical protein
MKKSINRFSKPKARTRDTVENWHNGADVEIHFYAQSLQKAAKALIEKLELDGKPGADWDVGPILLLYRTAVELHLKAVVGEGSHFLKTATDHITLYKTHSLRWLAQIVCQIIKKVGWESEFSCEGAPTLADFSALIAEVEGMEPVSAAIQADPKKKKLGEVPQQLGRKKVLEIASKLDGLIDLLAATAEDLRADAAGGAELGGDDFTPTIQ